MEAEDSGWSGGENQTPVKYGVSKKLKRLWGSVTVQVLQAQAQPLVKREILPIII